MPSEYDLSEINLFSEKLHRGLRHLKFGKGRIRDRLREVVLPFFGHAARHADSLPPELRERWEYLREEVASINQGAEGRIRGAVQFMSEDDAREVAQSLNLFAARVDNFREEIRNF